MGQRDTCRCRNTFNKENLKGQVIDANWICDWF